MKPSAESLSPKDRATQVLEDAKRRLEQTIRHPLVPSVATSTIVRLLPHVVLVTDAEYTDIVMQATIRPPITPDNEKEIKQECSLGTAALIRRHPRTGQPAIILKRRYPEENPSAPLYLPSLLAHEASHGVPVKTIPLSSVPDHTAALQAWKTKDRVVERINEMRRDWFNQTDLLTAEDMMVILDGFKSSFQDRNTGAIFPGEGTQQAFDETRAIIVQTIFDIILTGMRLHRKSPPEKQFQIGLKQLKEDHTVNRVLRIYDRFNDALDYLDARFSQIRRDGKAVPQVVPVILTDLFTKISNQFLTPPFDSAQETFMEMVRGYIKNYQYNK